MPRHAAPALTAFAIALLAAMLSGCLGGSVAQQIASSVATQTADHVVGNVVDEQLRIEREPRRINLMNSEPDPFVAKFLFMQFPDPESAQVIVEPLPPHPGLDDTRADASRLVAVEIWSLIIGQEKQAVLERSLKNGSSILPAPTAWRDWQLATGSLQGRAGAQLYFLLPPDFGRVSSGDIAIVEISRLGGVHVARYRAD